MQPQTGAARVRETTHIATDKTDLRVVGVLEKQELNVW